MGKEKNGVKKKLKGKKIKMKVTKEGEREGKSR